MKNFLVALLFGAIIGGAAVWYWTGKKPESTPPPAPSAAKTPMERTMTDIKQTVTEKTDSLRTAIDAKLDILGLKADEIRKELTAKGKVVRTQSRGWASDLKDAAVDAKITTEIKGKYALDKEVSALNVSVNTTDGVVTLSGMASSYDEISKAMLIAMETEGVRQVVSTIQVRQ